MPTHAEHGGRWFRRALWLHRWTGLLATPFFLILCLTGSILIFHEEVDRLIGDAPPVAAAPPHPLGFSAISIAAQRLEPGKSVQSVVFSADEPDRAFVGMVPPGPSKLADGKLLILDRGTGALLPFTDPEASFTGILLKLHAQWFADVPGELFGSTIAVLVFLCLVTGVIVHAPFVRRMAFGVIRRGKSGRIVQLDLHNLVGVVVLGWASIVAFTGICLGLGSILLGLWQNTELTAMAGGTGLTRPPIVISLDRAASVAATAMPDREASFAISPDTDFSSPRHYTFLMFGKQPHNEHLFDIVLVDAETGKVAAAKPLPWYLKVIVLSGPLHFGNYGGLALKLLWVTSAFGALFITGNGAWLWWARQRKRKRATAAMPLMQGEAE